ncbi:hypothetical protein [Enterococcus sp. LJL51]|uniref:hypothetical protein n=1 Tax=Enterococcus sp. LJL51 TaxID=3416656 RepID=UPI003CE82979
MITPYDFVYFERLYSYEALRNERGYSEGRQGRILHVRLPKTSMKLSFILNHKIELPELKKNAKLVLTVDLFHRGKNKRAETKIIAVDLYE